MYSIVYFDFADQRNGKQQYQKHGKHMCLGKWMISISDNMLENCREVFLILNFEF